MVLELGLTIFGLISISTRRSSRDMIRLITTDSLLGSSKKKRTKIFKKVKTKRRTNQLISEQRSRMMLVHTSRRIKTTSRMLLKTKLKMILNLEPSNWSLKSIFQVAQSTIPPSGCSSMRIIHLLLINSRPN
jgi:hypothetical protein